MHAGIFQFNTYLLLSLYYHLQLGDSQSRSKHDYMRFFSVGMPIIQGRIIRSPKNLSRIAVPNLSQRTLRYHLVPKRGLGCLQPDHLHDIHPLQLSNKRHPFFRAAGLHHHRIVNRSISHPAVPGLKCIQYLRREE